MNISEFNKRTFAWMGKAVGDKPDAGTANLNEILIS